MNPDKLFDYLDGRLPETERAELEQQLMSDQQLQRELAAAIRIHAGMRVSALPGREVLLPAEANVSERGRRLALRIGVAFIILMALNVGAGLWVISRHETQKNNRQALEEQMRQQLTKSIAQAAAAALTPAPLGVSELTIPAAPGQLDAVANEVVAIVQRLGGSAIKGFPEQHRLGLLIDLPAARETEFRAAISAITGGRPGSPSPATAETVAPASEKKSFAVQIIESSPPQN
jgi:anti-sigma factor RsiW